MTLEETRILADAIERYCMDHLRDPQYQKDKQAKLFLLGVVHDAHVHITEAQKELAESVVLEGENASEPESEPESGEPGQEPEQEASDATGEKPKRKYVPRKSAG